MTRFRWGILGTGTIAGAMAEALADVPGAARSGVGSRSMETARAFADRWGFERAYPSYAALLADDEIDIVYIATPNALHKDNIRDALAAGKHVLCEKPMTLSPDDSARCFDAATDAGLVLMEALWTAFFPAMRKAVELVQQDAIGPVQCLFADFVAYRDPAAHPNLFDPARGGGARNDLGIYPVAAARMLAGPVVSAQTEMVMGDTGVDEMAAMCLRHDSGALSLITFGFRVEMPVALRVVGTRGAIEIPETFYHPQQVVLTRDGARTGFDLPSIGRGYAHEAIAFQDLVAQGSAETSAWPPAFTLDCARILLTGGA
ncbi:MAG: Gfo/Idh/MocA family oxidoreductase [Pseudomonadota bacterium]